MLDMGGLVKMAVAPKKLYQSTANLFLLKQVYLAPQPDEHRVPHP